MDKIEPFQFIAALLGFIFLVFSPFFTELFANLALILGLVALGLSAWRGQTLNLKLKWPFYVAIALFILKFVIDLFVPIF